MFDIFGDTMPLPLKFFIAFAVVLALIGLTAWLVRRFGADRLGGANGRGRQPRLAVIDASQVDSRRRLVLIRRDNVEHLLMIGGPTDLVVEQNIVRGAAASASREPARTEPALPATREPAAREPARDPSLREPPRQGAASDAWPLQPVNEPAPVSPPRPPYRAAAASTEEPWLAPEPGARPRPADAPSSSELSARLAPSDVPQPALRNEPPVRSSPPPQVTVPEPVAVQTQDEHNLAEMAQQLEAALRRPPEPRSPEPRSHEPRTPVTDALAQAPKTPARDYKLRIDPRFENRPDAKFDAKFDALSEPAFDAKPEPKVEPKVEPKFDMRAEPKFEPAAEPRPQQPGPVSKNVFDNLEEEMASLLGRPPGKT